MSAHPLNPLVCQYVGVLFCEAGNTADGIKLLRRALSHAPQSKSARLNLAKALVAGGQLAEALTIASDGVDADLDTLRGDILKAQGDLPGAIAAYELSVKAKPAGYEAWNNLGNALRSLGRPEHAVRAFEHAVALQPNVATLHSNMAFAQRDARDFWAAAASLKTAVGLQPREASHHKELARVMLAIGQAETALPPLNEAVRLNPNDPETHILLGTALLTLDQESAAESSYRRALNLNPSNKMAVLNLGLLLEYGNRIRDLELVLSDAAARGVSSIDLAVLKARIALRTGNLEEAGQLLTAAGTSELPELEVLRLRLLGELQDRLGDVDAAFAAFAGMNSRLASIARASVVDKTAYRSRIERQLEFTTKDWIDNWLVDERPKPMESPSFLVGYPRSGTTLLDTILLGHPSIAVLEEVAIIERLADQAGDAQSIGRIPQSGLDPLRQAYFAQADDRLGGIRGRVIVDKLPLRLSKAAFIHRLFPKAKFLFALRHPCDAVLSCYMQNFQLNDAMANMQDLSDAARLYDRVMTYWMRCRDLLPIDVHTIRYESLVEQTEQEARAVLSFLGLTWADSVLDHTKTARERGRINTPSYAQVTERVHTRSVDRWERYKNHMKDVLPVLAPWVRRFGYGGVD